MAINPVYVCIIEPNLNIEEFVHTWSPNLLKVV